MKAVRALPNHETTNAFHGPVLDLTNLLMSTSTLAPSGPFQ